ncbi:MAG: TauD/TfdA family dioxygenase [Pseudomonadota bacterium]
MHIEPLHDELGAKITDIDLAETPAGDTLEAICEAIDTHSFVWFPDQPFDDDRQLALTKALGEPEPGHVAYGEEGKIEYFGTIGNVQQDGTALGETAQKTKFLKGNNLWHSDASFKAVPAFASIMCAYETPAEGGETLFVSTRSAWDRLDEDRQAELEPMIGIHDYTYSRSKVAEVKPSLSASLPPVRQKLVRTNPRNGRKNLFLGSHCREIEGMGYDASRALLEDLTTEAVADEHVLWHRWQPGDLVIWDNRCLIHRGAGYDADKYRRYMRQTRVSGTSSSLEE